jgi:O-antigen ligase
VNGLLVLELCVLAFLTSQFTTNRRRLNAVVLVVAIVALYTAGLAVLGLGLFYAGLDSSLVGGYGALTPTDRYARVAAGFYSPALLSSFCIFASALVAHEDAEIPRRLRRAAQIALAGLVILTFSRAVIGFAAAIAIRAGFARRDSRGMRFATGAAVVVAVGLMVALTVGRLQIDPSRPTSISYAVPGQYNFRWHQVNDGLDSIAEHPLVGKGPGSLPSDAFGVPSRAHVTPLQIAVTMGLPALGAMVFLVATLWRNRRRPTPIATWSGLAGLAIDGLGHDIDHFRHVWIMLGLADAERRPDRSLRAAPDRETVRDRPS